MLTLYKDWAPSEHDTKGLNSDVPQDWFVAPVILTRDSDTLSESNFLCAQMLFGDNAETFRFGHWACGWFEILLVKPEAKAQLEQFHKDLDAYPVVDEHHWSELEMQYHDQGRCDEHCSLCEMDQQNQSNEDNE